MMRPCLLRDTLDFVRRNRKWWLIPVMIVFALLAGLVVLSSSGVAPLIYTLF